MLSVDEVCQIPSVQDAYRVLEDLNRLGAINLPWANMGLPLYESTTWEECIEVLLRAKNAMMAKPDFWDNPAAKKDCGMLCIATSDIRASVAAKVEAENLFTMSICSREH